MSFNPKELKGKVLEEKSTRKDKKLSKTVSFLYMYRKMFSTFSCCFGVKKSRKVKRKL